MKVSETDSGSGGGGGGVVAHKGDCLQCCNNLKTCPQCGDFVRYMHDESE